MHIFVSIFAYERKEKENFFFFVLLKDVNSKLLNIVKRNILSIEIAYNQIKNIDIF